MKFYIENVSHGVLEIIEGDNPLAALQAYGKQCIRPHTK